MAVTAPRRGLLIAGAVVALVITLAFALVGDGVSTTRGGLPGPTINHAHMGVRGLLCVALAIAAVSGRWQPISTGLAWTALALYVIFIVTLVLVR